MKRTNIDLAPALMAEIAWEASQRGALVDYIPLEKPIRVEARPEVGSTLAERLATRVCYSFPIRQTAEDFTRWLAGKGLVFQVDFYYDLRLTVSFVVS